MTDWIPTSERLAHAHEDEHDPKRMVLVQYGDGGMKLVAARTVCEEYHVAWCELPDPYVQPMRLIVDRESYLWKGPVTVGHEIYWCRFAGFTEDGGYLWSAMSKTAPNDMSNREIKIP